MRVCHCTIPYMHGNDACKNCHNNHDSTTNDNMFFETIEHTVTKNEKVIVKINTTTSNDFANHDFLGCKAITSCDSLPISQIKIG